MNVPNDRLSPMMAPAVLSGLILLAFALRSIGLDLTFRSADETAVATRILKFPGFAWMFREYYGLLINLIVKFWAAGVSVLGITLTEFWWKLPVALAGTLYVPLVWGYLGSLDARTGRLCRGVGGIYPAHRRLVRGGTPALDLCPSMLVSSTGPLTGLTHPKSGCGEPERGRCRSFPA